MSEPQKNYMPILPSRDTNERAVPGLLVGDPRDQAGIVFNESIRERQWLSRLFLGLIYWTLLTANGWAQDEKQSKSNDDLKVAESLERQIEQAIEVGSQSVVAIARVRKDDLEDPTSPDFVPRQYGTGIAIAENGLILTCYHVLGDPRKHDYYIWFSGVPFKVREVQKTKLVMAADPWTDLAVLKVDAKLKPIQFAKPTTARRGQMVISLGNPYGIAHDGVVSASFGIVSNLLRQRTIKSASELDDSTSGKFSQYGTLIQTDAKLNRGTSGGPLINLKGEMVGLTSALAATDRYDAAAGFAVPVDATFLRTVEKLKAGRSVDFGFLGIATRELSLAQRQQFKKGVVITQVVENTPAASGGLLFGDVITHVAGNEISSTNALLRELSGRFANEEIVLSVLRKPFPDAGLKKMDLKVRLGKKRIKDRQPTIGVNDFSAWRGLSIDYPTAVDDLADHIKKIDPEGCIVITEVKPNSPAAKAGLQKHDFVSHVGIQRISSPAQFIQLVQNNKGAVQLRLTNKEDGKNITRTIDPE